LFTYLWLACRFLQSAVRSRCDVALENLVLRQQLAVLSRQQRRPRLQPADRLFWSWLARMWSGWRSTVVLVQPETVIRWQRTAWRRYWSWRSRRSRGPGRPPVSREVKDLIRRLAHENRRWGSVRIVGELRKLGYEVSAQTVRRYRPDARGRPPSQSWQTFLRNHAPHIWAADFFTVQTLTFKTLFVFLFISYCRRKLVHLNVTAHPTAEWVWRQLIEATPWGGAAEAPHPRQGLLLRGELQCEGSQSWYRGHSHSHPGAEGQCCCRARGRHVTQGVPGPCHRHQ